MLSHDPSGTCGGSCTHAEGGARSEDLGSGGGSCSGSGDGAQGADERGCPMIGSSSKVGRDVDKFGGPAGCKLRRKSLSGGGAGQGGGAEAERGCRPETRAEHRAESVAPGSLEQDAPPESALAADPGLQSTAPRAASSAPAAGGRPAGPAAGAFPTAPSGGLQQQQQQQQRVRNTPGQVRPAKETKEPRGPLALLSRTHAPRGKDSVGVAEPSSMVEEGRGGKGAAEPCSTVEEECSVEELVKPSSAAGEESAGIETGMESAVGLGGWEPWHGGRDVAGEDPEAADNAGGGMHGEGGGGSLGQEDAWAGFGGPETETEGGAQEGGAAQVEGLSLQRHEVPHKEGGAQEEGAAQQTRGTPQKEGAAQEQGAVQQRHGSVGMVEESVGMVEESTGICGGAGGDEGVGHAQHAQHAQHADAAIQISNAGRDLQPCCSLLALVSLRESQALVPAPAPVHLLPVPCLLPWTGQLASPMTYLTICCLVWLPGPMQYPFWWRQATRQSA